VKEEVFTDDKNFPPLKDAWNELQQSQIFIKATKEVEETQFINLFGNFAEKIHIINWMLWLFL